MTCIAVRVRGPNIVSDKRRIYRPLLQRTLAPTVLCRRSANALSNGSEVVDEACRRISARFWRYDSAGAVLQRSLRHGFRGRADHRIARATASAPKARSHGSDRVVSNPLPAPQKDRREHGAEPHCSDRARASERSRQAARKIAASSTKISTRPDEVRSVHTLIGWAIVQAANISAMNNGFGVIDGQPSRIETKESILDAIDIRKRMVAKPSCSDIKHCESMNFAQFFDAYHEQVKKARDGKLEIADFQGRRSR